MELKRGTVAQLRHDLEQAYATIAALRSEIADDGVLLDTAGDVIEHQERQLKTWGVGASWDLFLQNRRLDEENRQMRVLDDTSLGELIRAARRRVIARRETIIAAFIAETGCLPSEIEQVEERTVNGSRWYLRKRKDASSDA
jgi:hypothetical protein